MEVSTWPLRWWSYYW